MQRLKDAEIKLFGGNIPLPADGDDETVAGDRKFLTETEEEETEESEQVTEEVVPTLEDDTGANENTKMPSIDGKEAKLKLGKAGKLQNDSENSQKKPDKILPCPWCSSKGTKFCYYNNYSINEPRHFCKACQRYWIVGGTMRNVTVGAGRRRRKNSGSQTKHLRSIGRVVSFALGEKKLHNVIRDCLHDKLQDRVVSATSGHSENGDDCSSGSSQTVSNSTDGGGTMSMTEPGTRKLPCLSAVPWPYQWQFHPKPLWNEPLLSPSSLIKTSPKSDPSPAQLGKHSREDNEEQLDNEKLRKQVSNGCVLVPKALRIGVPAKISSIWAALGIKNEYSLAFGGIPKSKSIGMNCASEKDLIMHANPAAFSRSQIFQERS